MRLCDQGLSARAVGRRLGVPDRTVRMWRAGFVPKPTRRSKPPDFEALPPEDYAYLLGLYLGDGWIAAIGGRTFSLRISLDQRYPAIIAAAARAMASVNPGKRVRIWRRRESDAVVASFWVHWPTVFPQLGPGPKHARRIVMQDWQERITAAYPETFIRGLIHSDGSRYRAVVRSRGREYVVRALQLQQPVRRHQGAVLRPPRSAWHSLDAAERPADRCCDASRRGSARRLHWPEALTAREVPRAVSGTSGASAPCPRMGAPGVEQRGQPVACRPLA